MPPLTDQQTQTDAAPDPYAGVTNKTLLDTYKQNYSDMPFGAFVNKLYTKNYSDMPWSAFAGKIGYQGTQLGISDEDQGTPLTSKQAVAQLPMAKTEGMPSEIPVGDGSKLADVISSPEAMNADVPQSQGPNPGLAAVGQKIAEAWKNSPTVLTPQAQSWLDHTGLGGVTRLADIALAAPNAVFAGGVEMAGQTADALLGKNAGHGVREMGEYLATTGAPELTMAPMEPHVAAGTPHELPHEIAPEPSPPSTTPTLDAMAAEAHKQVAPVPQEVRPAAQTPEAMAAAEELPPPAAEPVQAVQTPDGHVIPVPPEAAAVPHAPAEPAAEAPVEKPPPVAESAEPAPVTQAEREAVLSQIEPPETPAESDTTPAKQSGRQPTPFEPPPREPTRLIDWLRRPTVLNQGTIHEQTIPGGVKDVGGDLKAILGGSKGRPGLINNKAGRDLDAATEMAWEAGYLPEHSERPEINDLLNAIAEDHNGNPRYSHLDQDAVDEYHGATERNAEVERLGNQYEIPTRGITRDQFYDQLADRMSTEDHAREIASQDEAAGAAYAEAEKQAKQWVAEHPPQEGVESEPWNAQHFYGQSQARTLDDLEKEYAQEADATAARERQASGEQPGPAGEHPGAVPEGGEPRGGGAGTGQAEGPQDLLGRPIAEPKPKAAPEPTIRSDARQELIPGTEASAVQAQAARDAGRGTLASDAAQKPADEGLFAPDTSGQGVLYSNPLFDPQAWRRAFGPLAPVARSVREASRAITQSIADGLAPIQAGSKRAQAFAGDFANALRRANYRYGEIDKELERNFTPAERDQMGRALDVQSVFEQQLRDMPADQQAQVRADFDAGKTGLASLTDKQRRAIDALDAISQDVWRRMQDRGLVAPNAQGLPYYMPRQVLMWTEAEGFKRPSSGGGGSGRGLEGRGANLTTQGPMKREHLTPEETEAAARAKLGDNAQLLRDIRSLPARLAYSERAIAGADLMNAIDKVGKDAGVDLVVKGDIPGLLEPGDYFTMADHPAFRRWTGTGWQAMHVAKEFEGPLKAVLTKASPTWYRAAQSLKGGVMSAIMYSPFIHLAVELGRALPVMPMRILAFRALRDGSTLRRDLGYMDQATKDGLAPLGRGWSVDPATIADQALTEGRGGFLRSLSQARDAVANAAGKVGGQWAHDVIQHPHQTLLWDQVFNLQVGIYDAMRNKYVGEGYAPEVAGTMAAHIANRYAGALPPEHLSQSANMAANLLLFSRSFTLGNLGVMKDMLSGAPSHVRARIEQMAGSDVAKSAQTALRRKAIAAFTMDVGLFYMANGLLQSGLQVLRQTPTQGLPQAAQNTFNDWYDKAKSAVSSAGSNPLSIFGVLPQHWNEPGKQDRVYAGTDSTGRGVYLRLPPGKVGEEFLGWFAKPGTMLINKASPLVRPVLESIIGSDSLGRQLLPPNPTTIGDYLRTAGIVAKHIGENLGPVSLIQGLHEMYQQHIEGKPTQSDPYVSAMKVFGPLTGFAQVSQGFPGGPASGEIHAQTERQKFDTQQAMPAIRQKIKDGDVEGAVGDMTKLGMERGLQKYYIRQSLNPGTTRGQLRRFERTAPPEAKERAQRLGAP